MLSDAVVTGDGCQHRQTLTKWPSRRRNTRGQCVVVTFKQVSESFEEAEAVNRGFVLLRQWVAHKRGLRDTLV